MRALQRPFLLAAIAVLAVASIFVAATVDHRHKQATMNRMELREWYCAHEGTHCGEGDSDRVERRWNERELGYKSAVVVLSCGAAVLLVAGFRRRI